MDQNPNSLTILNGYKDEEYIRLALLGTQMGRNTVIVVEKPSEVDLIIKVSKELNIKANYWYSLASWNEVRR